MLAVGFSVLMTSALPPVFKLGLLIAIAAIASFIGGFVVTTAAFAQKDRTIAVRPQKGLAILAVGVLAMIAFSNGAEAQNDLTYTGREIAEKIDERNDGDNVARDIRMELVDRRGRTRVRNARAYRRKLGDLDQSVLFYTAPNALRDTAFLTHDDPDDRASDRQWLFLPAARRSKQIPTSNRGEYFLGTDFTYEDMRSELKFNLEDYNFERLPDQESDTENIVRIRALPVSEKIAKELGYGEVRAQIDTNTWLPVIIEFDDPRGRSLKKIEVSQFEQIDNIWMATRIEAINFRDDHQTRFIYSDIVVAHAQDDRIFSPNGLRHGAP